MVVWLPTAGAEAEADARAPAVIAVTAIVVAGPTIIAVAPADHVAVVSAIVALDVAGTTGPVASAILVANETDPLDARSLR